MEDTTSFILKPFQVPEHLSGEVHAQCAYCNYQTQCQHAAVCESCFGKRLKLCRPERIPNMCETKLVLNKYNSRDGWTHIHREEVYKYDFNKLSKYRMFACDCSLCGQQGWSVYTVPVCKSCIDCIQPDIFGRSAEPAYMSSVLTSRFPANTLFPGNICGSSAMLDVIPHIAACLLAATAGDIGMAIAALLNLMEAVQCLVSPQVIIGHIRTHSPKLYSAWHDFLLGMKYMTEHTSQTIPVVFGHVCYLSNEYNEVRDSDGDVEYHCKCECPLRHQYMIGSNYYPPRRLDSDSRYRFVGLTNENTTISKLIDRLIDLHYQRQITAIVKTVTYMNAGTVADSNIVSPNKCLAIQHPKNIKTQKKKKRQTIQRHTRYPGKSKHLNYQLGNFSLV